MGNINTQSYWDKRFQGDWADNNGDLQTSFFAQLAIELMPQWLTQEIMASHYSICDFGCAYGQAAFELKQAFQTSVSGMDFSAQAIEVAKSNYPDIPFFVGSVLDSPTQQFDVAFSSNVLEHLDHPWQSAERIAAWAEKYLIIMIPFRERLSIEEHVNKFDSDDIPLSIGRFSLCFAAATDAEERENSQYNSPQLLLVYAHDPRPAKLSDLSSSIEQLGVEAARKPLVDKNQRLTEKLRSAKRRAARAEKELARNTRRLESEVSTRDKRIRKLEASVAKLKRENDEMKRSNSWRIGRAITAIPRRIRRIFLSR